MLKASTRSWRLNASEIRGVRMFLTSDRSTFTSRRPTSLLRRSFPCAFSQATGPLLAVVPPCARSLPRGGRPARGDDGGRLVLGIGAERPVIDVADAEEIFEAVGCDDLAVIRERRVDRFLGLVEVGAQVPLALVGGVIAERGHPVADGLHVRRHVGLPQGIRVVEDAGVLDVAAGIDGRARRRAYAGRGLMFGEGETVLL